MTRVPARSSSSSPSGSSNRSRKWTAAMTSWATQTPRVSTTAVEKFPFSSSRPASSNVYVRPIWVERGDRLPSKPPSHNPFVILEVDLDPASCRLSDDGVPCARHAIDGAETNLVEQPIQPRPEAGTTDQDPEDQRHEEANGSRPPKHLRLVASELPVEVIAQDPRCPERECQSLENRPRGDNGEQESKIGRLGDMGDDSSGNLGEDVARQQHERNDDQSLDGRWRIPLLRSSKRSACRSGG